jgi:hypothetical protein
MNQSINFKAVIRFLDFHINTGLTDISVYCPDYSVNQYSTLTYDQYHHLISLVPKYGRFVNNVLIIDRCFVNPILNNSL